MFFSPQYGYTEEYQHQRGKGSFPAHLTPGYKMSKKASELASDVSRHPTEHGHHFRPPLTGLLLPRSSIDRRMNRRLKVKPALKQPWLKLSTPEKTERTSVRSEVCTPGSQCLISKSISRSVCICFFKVTKMKKAQYTSEKKLIQFPYMSDPLKVCSADDKT